MQQLLDAVNEAKLWKALLSSLPEELQDVYFEPEYSALQNESTTTRASMFVFQQGDKLWLYPFLLRKVGTVGDCKLESDWFDIESQYGYAGPVANSDDAGFLHEAAKAFTSWCMDTNIVAEFVRLHPLLRNERWLDPQVEVVYDRTTVSLDLRDVAETKEPVEHSFNKTARYMVRRAESAGLQVETANDDASFARFTRLYWDTMDRLNADRSYYFDRAYFDQLRSLVRDRGWLVFVSAAGESVTAGVFLKGKRWLHYHLSASAAGNRLPGATNLLIRTAAQLGKEQGYTRLHLGGGASSDNNDSLLAFKRSMATDSHRYCIGKRIHNNEIYQRLKLAWQKANPSLVSNLGGRLLCYRFGMTN